MHITNPLQFLHKHAHLHIPGCMDKKVPTLLLNPNLILCFKIGKKKKLKW